MKKKLPRKTNARTKNQNIFTNNFSFMKKQKFLLGAAGLFAIGLTACSNDADLGFQGQKVDKDQTRYITVSLCTPTNYMTRDGEFENGRTEESAVNDLIFVFYDGTGAPTAASVNLHANEIKDADWTNTTGDNNVTRFWTSTIPIELAQGQDVPVYVMCYVNPIDQTNLTRMTLSEVDAATRTAVMQNGYFAMSNAVYYGDNPITGQTNVRLMATPITSDQLYATEDEAKANPALEIYVERYAAKIGVDMAPAAIQEYDVMVAGNNGSMTEGKIRFTPEYWRPNAVDLKTNITKNFSTDADGSDPTVPAAFAAMNAAFANTGMAGTTANPGQGLTGWNDATNHRSYWACSPSYYDEEYPQVSDNITDEADYPYNVKYFTYDEVARGVEGTPIVWNATSGFTTSNTADDSGYFYSRETTASIKFLTQANYNNKAVPASANIIGRYQLTGQEGAATTFYLYGKSEGKDVYYTDANIEQALIANQNVIFTNVTGTTKATNIDLFVVKHPEKAVRTETVTSDDAEGNPQTTVKDMNVAGRLVTLQIDENNIPNTPLYFYDGTGMVQIDRTNVVAANKLLWASASTAQKFHEGLAFFPIPIRHLGWGINVPADKPLLNDELTTGRPYAINWENLRRGDLGVVRNHVYNIEVTSVQGLGIGLASPSQPMVPPMDPDNYYISAKVNILSWRVVPKATVVL
ncbi:MAG: fimbria major subunit [Muribaculaceae bacterium]|nr:fimbria major subunit [Muribaculaceae bacterium]